MILVTAFNAKNPKNLIQYPQIKAKKWTKKTMILNLLSWAIYLFGYEFYFRGLLLFPIAEELGLWPAIAINIALYTGTHLPKGLTETIGAIPFSVILCLLSLSTGTIWIAFSLHICMSWTNAILSFRHNSEMSWLQESKLPKNKKPSTSAKF